MILLPNRELLQAHFFPAADNSFRQQEKQDWERFMVQKWNAS
jgi:hypothetical protein